MKYFILSTLIFLFLSTSVRSQNPIVWKKIYNSTYPRSIVDLLIIDTSYYILSEKTQNYYDVELLSINKNSSIVGVSETYSGQDADRPFSMYKTDSSIYIFGETFSQEGIFNHNHGKWDVFYLKTNLNGDLVNPVFFGGTQSETGFVSKISTNKYIGIGTSNSIDGDLSSCTPSSSFRSWVFSCDSMGNVLSSNCNDTIQTIKGSFFYQNGHYYLLTSGTLITTGGYTYDYPPNSQGNPGGPSSDFLVVEYDTAFNINNVKNYGSDSNEGLKKSLRTSDNGFMLFGYTDFVHDTLEVSGGIGARDLYCVKLDSNANFQWSKCLGSLAADYPMDITQTADNGYLVMGEIQQASGNVSHFYGFRDIWLAKIDSIGNMQWESTYGGSYLDRGNVVREDSDGTIVIAGTTQSTDGTFSGMSIQGQSDMFIIKLAPWVGIESGEEVKTTISVYPNPTYSGGTINLSGLSPVTTNYQLSIYNLQGQQVHFEDFSVANCKKVQLPQLANGMYFIRLQNTEGHVSNAKFIVN